MAKKSMIDKEAKRRALVEKGEYPEVKLRNRCNSCGRPRAYYRDFGLCRLCFRKAAHEGLLPGVTKSSW